MTLQLSDTLAGMDSMDSHKEDTRKALRAGTIPPLRIDQVEPTELIEGVGWTRAKRMLMAPIADEEWD